MKWQELFSGGVKSSHNNQYNNNKSKVHQQQWTIHKNTVLFGAEKQPPKTEVSPFPGVNTRTSLFPQTLFPLERRHAYSPLGLLNLKMVLSTYILGPCRAIEWQGRMRLSLFCGGQPITNAVNSLLQRPCLVHLRIHAPFPPRALCTENTQ